MKHYSSRYLLSLTFLTVLTLSIPFALILSQQSQRLMQHAQTIEQPAVAFSQELPDVSAPTTDTALVAEEASNPTNQLFHFLSTFVSLLWGLFGRA